MGYWDRFKGMLEIPLLEFVSGGDVPWHRVYYFKRGREVMWDRNNRIDTIFGSGYSSSGPDSGSDASTKKATEKKKKKKKHATSTTEHSRTTTSKPSTAVPSGKVKMANKPAVWTNLPVYRYSSATNSWQEAPTSIANRTNGVVD